MRGRKTKNSGVKKVWLRWWRRETKFTSSYDHSKITTIYRATTNKNDLKTSKKDFPQPKI